MKKTIYILFYTVIFLAAAPQNVVAQKLSWSQSMGGTEDEAVNTLVVDAQGNVYITGRFEATVDFGNKGDEKHIRTSAAGKANAFFAKFSPAGNLEFVRQLSSPEWSNGSSIKIDESGNIYVSGTYKTNVAFEGGSLTLESVPGNPKEENDIFLAKYKPDGNLIFAFRIGGTGSDDFPFFDVGADEKIYISGSFTQPVTFFSADATANSLNKAIKGERDVFLARYSNNGIFEIAKHIGGTNNEGPDALRLDEQGNVYLTGGTKSNDFDPDDNPATAHNLQAVVGDFHDIFILKYNKDFNLSLAKIVGGPGAESANGMYVNAAGEVYLTGKIGKDADFDPDAGTVIVPANDNDIYFAKFNADFTYNFAYAFGTTDAENEGKDITVDEEGKIYITGSSFDNIPALGLANSGKSDAFWAVFDASGTELLFSRQIGSEDSEIGKDIVTDPQGNIYTTGEYRNEVKFEPGETGASKGKRDLYLLKYTLDISLGQTIASNVPAPTHLSAADLDGDGNLDILSANAPGSDLSASSITWFSNDGTGNFSPQPVVGDNIQNPRSVFGADLDNDGDRDILAPLRNDNTIVWYENTNGVFDKTQRIISSQDTLPTPRSVFPADLDNDGDLDILAAFSGNVKIAWFENRFNETSKDFLPHAVDGITTSAEWIYAADLDGDGNQDILTASLEEGGRIFWHKNVEIDAETHAFATRKEAALPNAEFVTAADLNGDGKPEVIGVSKEKIVLFSIDAGGNLIAQKELTGILTDGAASVADMDGDNKPDIVFASAGDNKIAWYKNPGTLTGDFGSQRIITLQATGVRTLATPDLNNDGLPDVVWGAENKNEIAWAKNQLFTPINPGITTFNPASSFAGNTVTVYGTNFGNAPVVTFEKGGASVPAANVTVDDSGGNPKLVATLPANLPTGAYKLKVSNAGQVSVSIEDLLVPPTIAGGGVDTTKPVIAEVKGAGSPAAYFVPGTAKEFIVTSSDAGSGINEVILKYFGIREDGAAPSSVPLTNNGNGTYTIDIKDISVTDDLGLEYFFEVTDVAGNVARSPETTNLFLHRDQKATGIPASKASDKPDVSDYNLVAIPLDGITRDQVFDTLGIFGEKEDWWLFEYNAASQSYSVVSSGALNPRKGYMLIFRNAGAIQPQGKVLPVSPGQPVTIVIAPGFNLIGNPFPFSMSWADVVAYNAGVQGADQLKLSKFNRGNWEAGSSTLEAFKGALVINPTEASVTLNVPYKKADTGSRLSKGHDLSKLQPLDAPAWEVPLRIGAGDRTSLGGIGMHQEASASYDPKDDFTAPRFISYLELNSYHDEFFIPKFAKDVVPTQNAYTWELEVASNLASPEVTIAWDNYYFGNNGQELMLLDLHNHQIINMREATSYTFSVIEGTRQLKVFYGDAATVKANMLPETIAVGEAFPNPMQEQLTIPVSLPDGKINYELQVEIYSITGQLVRKIQNTALPAGYQTLRWDRQNQDGKTVDPGLYFYRVNVNNNDVLNNGRIIVR